MSTPSFPRFPARAGMAALAAALVLLSPGPAAAYDTEHVVLVIVDGLRYTEGLGDPMHTYVPEMAALTAQGAIVEPFQNDYVTKTWRAVPAIWCGVWTGISTFQDPACGNAENNYTDSPSLFEYYRKHLNRPQADCVYVLKDLCSWKASFHPDYGPAYWPLYHTRGYSDLDVWHEAEDVLDNLQPSFMLLYLADVDHGGHSGDWGEYTRAITVADSIVGMLWDRLETDPHYAGRTTMIVTNDHGRHTTDFSGHGDGCTGCRTIQLLAVGPDVRENFVSTTARVIPDITPTIGELLGFPTPHVTGSAMEEILKDQTGVGDPPPDPRAGSLALTVAGNPAVQTAEFRFRLEEPGPVAVAVYDVTGRVVATPVNRELPAGDHAARWDGHGTDGRLLPPGIYFVSVRANREAAGRRFVLLH